MSKGLEVLEKLKKYMYPKSKMTKKLPIIEKELKALEIIKNKQCIFKGLQEVSQEEYDLLKEVLL